MSMFKIVSVSARVLSIGISAALWYLTYKYIYKQINENENESKINDDYSDCYKVMRMKIPSYSKGAIIGKRGSTIKKIQEKTKTTIKFVTKSAKDPTCSKAMESSSDWTVDMTKDTNTESFEIVLIRGLTLRVMEAEKELKAVIDSVPIFTEDYMLIDNRFVGKLIGKKGENIKRLKDCHKVQIDVDKTTNPQRQVTLRGTCVNITECKSEIIKMIDSEILKENRFSHVPNGSIRSANKSVANPLPVSEKVHPTSSLNSENITKVIDGFPQSVVIYPGKLDEKIYIYVSSVVDCGKFYAHIINDDLHTLDNLIEEMTEHFSNKQQTCDASFNMDDVVAGFYEPSQTWQRVKIIGIEDGLYEIIFLDYGDCAKVKNNELRAFEPECNFLRLPFQALPLITHGIQPNGDNWTESDINEFESLTKVGYSYKIACILKNKNSINLEVQLIDEENNINIAEKMIAIGRAKGCI